MFVAAYGLLKDYKIALIKNNYEVYFFFKSIQKCQNLQPHESNLECTSYPFIWIFYKKDFGGQTLEFLKTMSIPEGQCGIFSLKKIVDQPIRLDSIRILPFLIVFTNFAIIC